MADLRIYLENCRETLNHARTMVTDSRMGRIDASGQEGTFLSDSRKAIQDIIRCGVNTGYITQRQQSYIDDLFVSYQRIRSLNENMEPGLREEAAAILDATRERAMPYRIKEQEHVSVDLLGVPHRHNNLIYQRGRAKVRARQIRSKEYFWDLHLEPAVKLVGNLKQHVGINVGDLEARLNRILPLITIGAPS